jgi:hypothetical protein
VQQDCWFSQSLRGPLASCEPTTPLGLTTMSAADSAAPWAERVAR